MTPCFGFGQFFHLESAGVRFGFDPSGAARNFYQGEVFAQWDLPWSWDLGSSWTLQSKLEASAGCVGESGSEAGIATFGPSLLLGRLNLPISLEGGVNPTLMTRSRFDSKDFGIPFQFTSHIGLNYDVSSRIRVSYRFQHMSNASLSSHNPGLNLHVLGLSYLF
ncbi:MAG TPA: acyloxyacyl hydrolase [Verrucomicrobiae bacterium]|nr:acyloxyacyl hydrolase [Verrucomicrobiae bacterium]